MLDAFSYLLAMLKIITAGIMAGSLDTAREYLFLEYLTRDKPELIMPA